MAMPVTRRWTLDEVHALADAATDGTRYELIDGVLLVTPAPRVRHQIVLGELLGEFLPYLRQTGVGVVLSAPTDLVLSPDAVTQPDLFVVPIEVDMATGGATILLVVEVLSPSTERTDRGLKRDFYLAHGAAEYWVVDADARTIERFERRIAQRTVCRDVILWRSDTAAPLRIDLVALFDRVDAADRATAWLPRR